jgi:hypothetical protein
MAKLGGMDSIVESFGTPTNTPLVIRPTETVTPEEVPTQEVIEITPQEEITLTPTEENPLETVPTPTPSGESGSAETLRSLEESVVPVNDQVDLGLRLQGLTDIPLTVLPPAAPRQVGERNTFWVIDTFAEDYFQVEAVLRYVTDHLYFWIEDGVRYDQDELIDLSETFETEIYPTNRAFFGSEWSPGIDGDVHLYILYAQNVGYGTAGYFSSEDEVHPLVHQFSNAHEMFVINADNAPLYDEYTYGTLAHEFQHMIHWYLDRNETSWLDEGFSELASLLNGYDPGGFDFEYIRRPDFQLNTWSDDDAENLAHYGASFLYVVYLLDRLGEEATQAIAAHPDNGLSSIDSVLDELEVVDPVSEQPVDADDLVLDWAITNYLLDGDVGDGRYAYYNYSEASRAKKTETIRNCNSEMQVRDVHQYGVDYIRFTCLGEHTLHFEGSVEAALLPANPYSGSYAFYSNKGNKSDMTLTRDFDFTNHSGPLTLTYMTWFDIEVDYDYVYLAASTDGESWEILTTPSGTAENPNGNSYGWGYTGYSGDGPVWIQESVDISRFAGEEVALRFEYVTDTALNGEGLLLDDVAIPEIDYFTDLESDDGGWEGAGFVRIQNTLPQTFRLALITKGATTEIVYIPLEADLSADIPINIGDNNDEVVLVVVGTTRFTRQLAAYQFNFSD